ncbi:hypothetical protein [Microlunatus speluncae]|uniref:hypothetical protein n=1 Tax=Microlunatus speluncae TaxID=2594267 RepID=UPI001C2D7A50|nr:hypothetical protein [Microlunatus speluncae]
MRRAASRTWRGQTNPLKTHRILRRHADLGISQFVLSDTPYLDEVARIGDQLLPLLRRPR